MESRMAGAILMGGGSTRRLAKSKKFHRVMHEYGEGSLKSSSGDKVTDVKQAKAIAFSEARRARRRHSRR